MGTKKDSKSKSKQIIAHIVERFLNPNMNYKSEDFATIAEILELPIYSLKNVSPDDAKIYQHLLHVQSLRDIAKLDYDHPLNKLIPAQTDLDIDLHLEKCEQVLTDARVQIGDLEKLRGSILIAGMISQAWKKRSAYLNKKETKVITVGLDNAGKTAILSSLGGKMGLDSLAKLKPTKRIERRKIQTDDLSLFLWDFGGQADYRELYVREPEKYFLNTDLVIYVIDMQDNERYGLSLDYFTEILKIMQRLSEAPYALIFCHKSDPDLIQDPDFQLNLEYVKSQIKEIMKTIPFDYDIYATSIYNFFSSEPKFSKFIKDVMRDETALNNPMAEKVQGIGDIVAKNLNAIVSLASSLGEQIAKINYRLDGMENSILNLQISAKRPAKAFAPPPPPPVQTMGQASLQQIEARAMSSRQTLNAIQDEKIAQERGEFQNQSQKTRASILTELASLFQKTKNMK